MYNANETSYIIMYMLKHCLTHALRNIKRKARSWDANKARDKAECFISIKTALSTSFHIKHEQGNAFTIPENHFDKNVFASEPLW